VATLSTPIIDRFVGYGIDNVRKRLWFANAAGELRRLTSAEATEFCRAYGAAIQHVSEILISKGLWR
jgi:hypothetical protein